MMIFYYLIWGLFTNKKCDFHSLVCTMFVLPEHGLHSLRVQASFHSLVCTMFVLLEHGLHSLRVQANFHSLVCTMFYKNAYLLRRDTHFVAKLQKLTIFPFILAKKAPMLYLKKQRCLANTALLFIHHPDIQ